MDEATRLARLAPRSGRLRVVMDTDTYNEIDDQFAVAQMMLAPERFAVEAIYAAPFANADRAATPAEGMEQSHAELLLLFDRLGMDPAGLLHKGATGSVGSTKAAQEAPAIDDLVARARASDPDDPLYVIAIAAITDIASALIKAPDIAERMVVVWLGGHALHWPHTREYNLEQDIGGAQVLLDSGVPLVLVPCEGVTDHLHSTIPEIEDLVAPCGAIGRFLADRFRDIADEEGSDPRGWSKPIWDMAAVAYLLDETWTPGFSTPTPILTDNGTWSFDPSRPAMRYVMAVQRDPILRDFVARLERHAGLRG